MNTKNPMNGMWTDKKAQADALSTFFADTMKEGADVSDNLDYLAGYLAGRFLATLKVN